MEETSIPKSFQKLLSERLHHRFSCRICYANYQIDMGIINGQIQPDCDLMKDLGLKINSWQPEPDEIWPPIKLNSAMDTLESKN